MEADNNNNRKAIDAHNMNNQLSAMARAKTANSKSMALHRVSYN